MLRNWTFLLLGLLALGLMASCSDSDPTVSPSGDISDDMVDVALESDVITEAMVGLELALMGAAPATGGVEATEGTTVERTFSRTQSCPAGGEMMAEGTIVRTYDEETGVMEAEINGSRSRTDCAFVRGEFTITVNGSAEWEIFRRRVDGRPDGLQTSHYSGSWTAVRSDGEERSCSFDYTVVRDPEERTRTIDGTACGGRVRRGMAWTPIGG